LAADYRSTQHRVVADVRAFLSSTTTTLGSFSTRDGMDVVADIEFRLRPVVRLFVISEGTLANDVRPDVQLPGLEKTASGLMAVGGRVYDDRGGRFGLAVGGAYNRQLNVEDQGLALYAELLGRREIDGYDLLVDGRLRTSNVAPRHNTNGYGQARIARTFAEGGSAALEVRYDLARSDLYIARSVDAILQLGGPTYSGLRKRSERRFHSLGSLSYPVDDDVTVDVALGISTDGVEQHQLYEGLPPAVGAVDPYTYDRDELALNMSAALEWRPGGMRLGGRFEYWTSEERNTVSAILPVSVVDLDRQRASSAQNDYVAQQVRLVGLLEVELGRRDTVSAVASVSIYRYDTPSAINAFDRDEQAIHAELRWYRAFNPQLSIDVTTQAFLTHLVYLFGENSNDNNWNRIVRFTPTVSYTSGRSFKNDLTAEVSANYTDYDFQDLSQTVRGRSFRELRLRDSMTVRIGDRTSLRATGDFRIAERGSFDWVRFVESPLERSRTEGTEAELVVDLSPGVMAGAGARLSRVKTLRLVPGTMELQPFSDRTSFGPTARFRLHLSERSDVMFSGWWEHRFDESRLAARLPWMNVTVQWNY